MEGVDRLWAGEQAGRGRKRERTDPCELCERFVKTLLLSVARRGVSSGLHLQYVTNRLLRRT